MKIRALTTATVIAISLLVPADIALASDEPASGDTSSVQGNTQKFSRYETAYSTVASHVLQACAWAGKGSPVTLWACAISAGQIAVQAVIANARRECIQLAPAPIGVMAFRYTGGYCR